MHDIAIDTTLPSPQAVVAPRLFTVLSGYAARSDFVLTLDLGIAGAAMSVPVTVEVGDSKTRTATEVPIALRATHHAGWFPRFRGGVRGEAVGPLESILRLEGTYETPLGAWGTWQIVPCWGMPRSEAYDRFSSVCGPMCSKRS